MGRGVGGGKFLGWWQVARVNRVESKVLPLLREKKKTLLHWLVHPANGGFPPAHTMNGVMKDLTVLTDTTSLGRCPPTRH